MDDRARGKELGKHEKSSVMKKIILKISKIFQRVRGKKFYDIINFSPRLCDDAKLAQFKGRNSDLSTSASYSSNLQTEMWDLRNTA